jgi:excisionase family DNA binding protein
MTTLETMLRQLVREAVRDELRAGSDHAPIRNASDAYLSVAKAARVADVAPGTIRAWIRAGRLTAKRAGRVLRISRDELERFMSGAPDKTRQAEIRRRATKLLDRGRRPLSAAA